MTDPWTRQIAQLSVAMDGALEAVAQRVEGPDRCLQFRPTDGAWTIVEIAEHVSLANHYLLILVDKIAAKARVRAPQTRGAYPSPSPLEPLERLASHAFHWESPRHMVPTGRERPGAIRERLAAQRRRMHALLGEFPRGEGTLHRIRMSVVGPSERLDLYEFLYLIALHAERHAEQMRRNEEACARQTPGQV